MATNIAYIQFKHLLHDASDAPVASGRVVVQFYNVHTKSWLALTDELPISNGKFSYQLKIPSRISTTDQTIRVVREVLKSGGIPSFRLVWVDKKISLPQLIAFNFGTSVEADTKLNVDFGKTWLLESDKYIKHTDHIVMATDIPVFELANTIRTIEAEKEAQVANLNESLEALQANLATEQSLRETLETNQTALETQLATQAELLENYEAAAATDSNFENLYLDLQQQVSEITILNSNLEQEKEVFLASISQLQTQVRDEKLRIKSQEAEIQANKDIIQSLEQQNQKLQADLDEAIDYNATEHPNKLTASKVYGSIVKDVIRADEELLNSKFKLANVSLNLKTTVEKGPEGTILGLLDYESAKDVNSAAISDISIDIVPNTTVTATVRKTMPNILGLTETAVRKVLLSYGLKLDAVYHPTNDDNLIAGQSFKQSPEPKDPVTEGQEVIVIFAKPLN